MAAIKLDGPYRLLVDDVQSATSASSCGVWALGSLRADGLFAVSFVGASYVHPARDLCEWIGTAPHFKWRAVADREIAFLQLCGLFHTFHPSGNFYHPERPKGTLLRCPHCDATHWSPAKGARHR